KHEHTRPEKVNDRADHIMHVGAQVGPVLSIFRQRSEIKPIFDAITQTPPTFDFVGDNRVRHELWVVNDPAEIDKLITAFSRMNELYIADGHHRSEAAAEAARRKKEQNPAHTGDEHYNFFLNVIFPDDELHILPYNRVVRDLNDLTPTELVERAQGKFAVIEKLRPVVPAKSYHFGMYVDSLWYELVARPGTFDAEHPSHSIDSAVLSANLLTPILGIGDIRTDRRIDFVGGTRGVQELVRLVDSGRYAVAFSLAPTTVEQLLRVADAGEVMPPKSTWFEPKLRSGLIVNMSDD
ncbi:MAG: DUF1015 family protein, partial [Candidatus Zixiibacteriota bacterium]